MHCRKDVKNVYIDETRLEVDGESQIIWGQREWVKAFGNGIQLSRRWFEANTLRFGEERREIN
jgi:hypothetical protein